MEYVGIDLHKKESQIGLLTEAGDVMERRIHTEPQRGSGVKQLDNAAIPFQLVQEFRSVRAALHLIPRFTTSLCPAALRPGKALYSRSGLQVPAIRLDGNRCSKPSPADCMSF